MSELNELLTRWLAGAALAQPAAVSFAAEWLGWLGLGIYLVVWLVTSRQFSRDERWTEIIFVAAATLAAWAASEAIKKFYFSPRPFEMLTDLAPLLTYGGDEAPSLRLTPLPFSLSLSPSDFIVRLSATF